MPHSHTTVEETIRTIGREMADNEWVQDDPYSPDRIDMPYHEFEKLMKKHLTTLTATVRESERKEFTKAVKALVPSHLQGILLNAIGVRWEAASDTVQVPVSVIKHIEDMRMPQTSHWRETGEMHYNKAIVEILALLSQPTKEIE